jgi:hypothetical protein
MREREPLMRERARERESEQRVGYVMRERVPLMRERERERARESERERERAARRIRDVVKRRDSCSESGGETGTAVIRRRDRDNRYKAERQGQPL